MSELLCEKSQVYPKISIGIVVYNGVEHISRALESIVGQPYKNLELIVVDGGSKDGTQNVLSEYAEHISVLVSEPDKGIYDAMNKVCSLATGDWLIFIGCDDVLLDTLDNIIGLMVDFDSIYYGDVVFRFSGKIYGGRFSKYRLMQQNICHQALFYPRSVYKKYSYSLDYKWLADHVYNLKLMGNAVPFVYIGVVVSIFNEKGRSSQGDADFSKVRVNLIRSLFGTTSALIGVLRIRLLGLRVLKARLVGITVRVISFVLKRLLPYSYWKYFQSWWRGMQ